MKNILVLTFLILFCSTLSAQIEQVQQTQNIIRSIDAIGTAPGKSAPMVRGFDNSFKGIIGTPYLSEDWNKGMLEEKNGNLYHDIYLRYDMVDDLIEMRSLSGKTVVFTKKQIIAFRIYTSEETFLTFKVFPEPVIKKKGDPNFYAQVMNNGDIQLLVRRRKYFIPKTTAVTPYHTNTNDTYRFKSEKYYVIFSGEETPKQLKRTKKSVLAIMQKHQAKIEDFIKLNQLFVGDDYHLAMIIDQYNKLEEENGNQ